jgi:aryl-alcohol dehydrogenase-like predicted oxidoreductase
MKNIIYRRKKTTGCGFCTLRVPRVHIALAWLLQKDPVTAPIIGATKITHLEDAVGALSVKLTQDEVVYLEEPYVPHRIVGHQ